MKKSNVMAEVIRINMYLKKLRRKYGDRLLNIEDVSPDNITQKYKTAKARLTRLQALTPKTIKEKLKVVDTSTGEIISVREQERRVRSESQKQSRESAQRFWSGEETITKDDVQLDVEYLPLKEEIEYNRMGEELSTMVGEDWNYQEFSTANYRELKSIVEQQFEMVDDSGKEQNKYGDAYKVKSRERALVVQNWLAKLTDKVGLGKVAQMINRYAGENSMTRMDIFYREGQNLEFMYRAMNYLDVDDDTRKELYNIIEQV